MSKPRPISAINREKMEIVMSKVRAALAPLLDAGEIEAVDVFMAMPAGGTLLVTGRVVDSVNSAALDVLRDRIPHMLATEPERVQ